MPPRRAQLLRGLLIALAVGRPLGAQDTRSTVTVRSVVEIGATAVRFPDDGTSAVGPSILASSEWDGRSLFASGSAAGVVAGGGGAGAALLSGGARRPLAAEWLGDVSGEIAAVTGGTSRVSRSATLSPRILRAFGAGGGWARASGSVASRELGQLWGRSVDAGTWWRGKGTLVRASLMREWSAGQLFAGPGREHPLAIIPVHFDEGALSAQIDAGTVTLSFGAALRHDPDAERRYDPGWNAEAVVWQTTSLAFVVSAARQLPDFIRGADAAQSFSVGLRWGGAGRPTRAPLEPSAVRPVLSIQPANDSLVLRVRAPGARRVEVMADFTDWQPLELTPEDGTFVHRLRLASGVYHALVRIDGGEWKPAANTPAVDDDLGGRVGLVVVP
ncbi:MAG TPA: glycogen-binding domain-containing protein [Gemmatimonadaceae bacterium]